MSPLIITRKLTKIYGTLRALYDCDLQVEPAEVLGLLGPNGAGKTTLIRLLLGFLKPTRGEACIGGFHCVTQSEEVRRITAYLPGDARLFPNMNGGEVLRFFAEMRPEGDARRSLQLAERLELDVSRRVAFMSTGMRQKLALAVTLAANTPLVILDEPTANLDPNVRSTVLSLVREAKAAGRTVVFSSHVMAEVEEACDRVVIVRRGELVHTQCLGELKRRHRIRATLRGEWIPPPIALANEISITREQDSLHLETPAALAPVLGWLATLPLEDVFIEPLGLQAVYDRFHSATVPSA